MNFKLLKLIKKNLEKKDSDDCERQPYWLSLALAILPAVLPVLIDKIGEFLMRFFFREEEEEEEEEKEEE